MCLSARTAHLAGLKLLWFDPRLEEQGPLMSLALRYNDFVSGDSC